MCTVTRPPTLGLQGSAVGSLKGAGSGSGQALSQALSPLTRKPGLQASVGLRELLPPPSISSEYLQKMGKHLSNSDDLAQGRPLSLS